MKKKILVLLSILTILTSIGNIAFAGTDPIDPAPIREGSVVIIICSGGTDPIPPAPIREDSVIISNLE